MKLSDETLKKYHVCKQKTIREDIYDSTIPGLIDRAEYLAKEHNTSLELISVSADPSDGYGFVFLEVICDKTEEELKIELKKMKAVFDQVEEDEKAYYEKLKKKYNHV